MSKDTRGTGNIYQRGSVWWIVYHFRGRRVRESSQSTKRADAVRLLNARLRSIGSGRPVLPDVARTSFEDLVRIISDDYAANRRRSKDSLARACRHLREFFGFERAIDITADRLTAYVRHRLDEGAAPATVRNELANLKRAFRLARRASKVVDVPPFPTITVDNVRTGFFEADELAAVLRHLPEPLHPVMRFAYFTGWRREEILGLRWKDVDFAAGVMRIEPGVAKNKEGRTFPFSALPPLALLLTEQREATTAFERSSGQIVPWVFHRDGRQVRSYDHAWRTARRKAGLPNRIVHDFRRTAVRNLERAGVPRSVAMQLTGHKTESVYRRYAIVAEADLREGVAKLAAMHTRVKTSSNERTATIPPQFATSGA